MPPSKQAQVPVSEQNIAHMFDRIAGKYDFLNALLSMRQDKRWRRFLVRSVPYRPDGSFLDVATGTGDVILAAARAHPEYASFLGVDISAAMLEQARLKLQHTTLSDTVNFQRMSAEVLNLAATSVDCVSISFGLRNVVNRMNALREFFRVMRPAGVLLILEFFPPKKGLMAALFQFYFHHILPLVGGLFSDKKAYTYLPQSVEGFYTCAELCAKLRETGFRDVRVKPFLFGSCCLVSARKP